MKKYNIKGQPPFRHFAYGSSVYGLTNELSDIDYMVLHIDPTYQLQEYPEDVDVWTLEQFQEKLDEHDLKALEVYFHNFDTFYNYYEMEFKLNKDKLRRSVSATCSNSYVKAKKKLYQGDKYIGLKSYWHCIRILTMFIHLARYKHFNPASFKNKLEVIYNTIMQYNTSTLEASHIIALLDTYHGYKQYLNTLQSEFRMLCPLEQNNK